MSGLSFGSFPSSVSVSCFSRSSSSSRVFSLAFPLALCLTFPALRSFSVCRAALACSRLTLLASSLISFTKVGCLRSILAKISFFVSLSRYFVLSTTLAQALRGGMLILKVSLITLSKISSSISYRGLCFSSNWYRWCKLSCANAYDIGKSDISLTELYRS